MLKTVTNIVNVSQITGVLPVVNGGTGVTTSTGTGNVVLSAAPTLSGDVSLSTGNLVIGTSGKGIDFSATPGTGTSELLADYEEGTWTPNVTPGSGSITTLGAVSGTYTKIGRIVVLNFDISITTNGTGGTYLGISDLPFLAKAAQCAEGVFKEIAVNGTLGSINVTLSSLLTLNKYDGTYPGVDGCRLIGTISYIV
jgi:hypothetical protein